MTPIAQYFNAERAESLVFVAAGLMAAGTALFFWFAVKKPLLNGMGWPLIIVALIQIVVGASVYLRSPKDIARVEHIVATDPVRIKTEEIPRMEKVMGNFEIYRWIEIGLVVLGVLLTLFAAQASVWRGVGLGLSLQAGLMLLLDLFAEQRGAAYLQYLRKGVFE